MNTSQRILLIGAALIGLSGCTINNSFPAGPGGEFSYSPDRLSTFAIANKSPVVFTSGMDSNERVRHVFGYPLVATNPMGSFLATHAMASSNEVVDMYLKKETVTCVFRPTVTGCFGRS